MQNNHSAATELCDILLGNVVDGNRRIKENGPHPPDGISGIKRLFTADLVWLFYMEKLGIFGIVREILEDFALYGHFPINVRIY